ncbi:MAG: ABC transporter permease, partial [Thermoplasmata archaeon]
ALAMFGLGLSGLLGKEYIGRPLPSSLIIRPVSIPALREIPVLGRFLFQQDPLVYLSIMLVVALWFALFKTRLGITIRSVGEDPATCDALGVNVYLTRYLCVLLGGVLAGLAGAHLSVAFAPAWTEGMTAGRGWIVIGLTIFAMWRPSRALLGAYLFGVVEALQYTLQPLRISPQILAMLPYVFAIVVLLIGTRETIRKRLGAPAALGIPYARGEK